MTARSYYLDDMDVTVGDRVRCKANLAAEWLIVNRVYLVVAFATIVCEDTGEQFKYPSARFQKV